MNEQHPERQAGQRWRFDGTLHGLGVRILTLVEMEGPNHWLCDVEGRPQSTFHVEWWTDYGGARMTLLSPAPIQAACKAPEWCGFDATTPKCELSKVDADKFDAFFRVPYDERRKVASGHRWFCSDACVVTPVPGPAANDSGTAFNAQIAEISRQVEEAMRKMAEPRWLIANPPPAQEAPKAPVCRGKHNSLSVYLCTGPVLKRFTVKGKPPFDLCEAHYLEAERSLSVRGGAIRGMPERLARPKLAHSFGVEDPALEDCR